MSTYQDIVRSHADREGPLLPILHEVQRRDGFISETAMRDIADALNITRAEIWGVVSFYHDFRTEPVGKPVLKLCRAEACKARGVEVLAADAQRGADAAGVALEPVYCLGLCSVGPAAMTEQGEVHARLDADKLAALIGRLA